MATQGPKPYIKLASTLVLVGMGLFTLEQFGLTRLTGDQHNTHLDGTLLSIMVLVPLVLVAAGALVFMFGKIRRL